MASTQALPLLSGSLFEDENSLQVRMNSRTISVAELIILLLSRSINNLILFFPVGRQFRGYKKECRTDYRRYCPRFLSGKLNNIRQ